jgi:hypothetical protein
MKIFIWLFVVIVAVSSISGCARARRIANDVDWIVFDGEPSEEN